MKRVLIVDLETTGLDRQRDQIIEIGYCLWSVEYRAMEECFSAVLGADQNPAYVVNGLSVELLCTKTSDPEVALAMIHDASSRADALVAHQADFDREFLQAALVPLADRPWICTREDFDWPRALHDRSLIGTALAHGVAVTSAHRSIHDVLLLVRLFEALPDVDERLERALVRAVRPKARFVAQAPFEQKDVVKQCGFRWDGSVWRRYMAIEDVPLLPFAAIREDELSP